MKLSQIIPSISFNEKVVVLFVFPSEQFLNQLGWVGMLETYQLQCNIVSQSPILFMRIYAERPMKINFETCMKFYTKNRKVFHINKHRLKYGIDEEGFIMQNNSLPYDVVSRYG